MIGSLIILIGSLVAWVGSLGLYGFGQLIDKVDDISYILENSTLGTVLEQELEKDYWECSICKTYNSNALKYCEKCGEKH